MKKTLLILSLVVLITGCSYNTPAEPQEEENNKQVSNLQEQKENNNMDTQNEKPQINEETKDFNKAVIKTNKGDIVISLNSQLAPITVENFKRYVSDGYYNGTIFHRVIDGFMIQGGGFDKEGAQKQTKAPIKNEANNGLNNNRGTITMARTQIVDSATSQFFINLVENNSLNYVDDNNYGYAVFGEVLEGMDVVDEIAKVQTGNNGPHQNWPTEDIVIDNIELKE